MRYKSFSPKNFIKLVPIKPSSKNFIFKLNIFIYLNKKLKKKILLSSRLKLIPQVTNTMNIIIREPKIIISRPGIIALQNSFKRKFFRRLRVNTVRRKRRRARRSCRSRRGRTYITTTCKWCTKKCARKRDGSVAYTCGWEHYIWSIRHGDFGPKRCPCRYKHNDAGKVGSRPRTLSWGKVLVLSCVEWPKREPSVESVWLLGGEQEHQGYHF